MQLAIEQLPDNLIGILALIVVLSLLCIVGCWVEYMVERRTKKILPHPSARVGDAYQRHWNNVPTRVKRHYNS